MYSSRLDYMCLNERYEIIEEKGRGGFGITYKARDIQQSPALIVAIKEIQLSQTDDDLEDRGPDYIKRLERESNALRRLEHPDIPRYLDSFYEGNFYYIVQEYIEGSDLTQEIVSRTKFLEDEAIDILREILDILIFVHRNNIIHRDIKPANIIRRESDKRLVLIDFGAVKEIATEQINNSGIQRTIAICSDGYTPAEQRRGNPKPNSDIHALGIMIMQSVTGFSIDAICNSNMPPIVDDNCDYLWEEHAPHISSGFKNIISKMIRFYFVERYQSVEEVLEDIEKLESQILEDDRDTEDKQEPQKPEINNEDNLQSVNSSPPVLQIVESIPINVPPSNQSQKDENDVDDVDDFGQDIVIPPGDDIFSSPDNRIGSPPKPVTSSYVKHRKIIKYAVIGLIACLTVIMLSIWGQNYLISKNLCSLNLEDNISCGEEILEPDYRNGHNSNKLRGTREYKSENYLEALNYFQTAWKTAYPDAETLIYLNNALLDVKGVNYDTISVAVPFSSDTKDVKSDLIAQDFLRGVAQAQTEVNLSFFMETEEIESELLPYDKLTKRSISKSKRKGLKVIIANDGNSTEKAQQIAKKIANNKGIKGIIGHYTSRMTLDTVLEYQAQGLAQISYGTTTKILTASPKNNFFRVVYTNQEEAEYLIEYLKQYPVENKNIALFFSRDSDYSNLLYIEIDGQIKKLKDPNIKIVKTYNLASEGNFSATTALKELDHSDLNVNICILVPDGLVTDSLNKAIEVIKKDNGQRLILGGNTLINPDVQKIATENRLNLVVATPWHYTTNQTNNLGRQFNLQNQKLWRNESNVSGGTAMAYDATLAMIEAIKSKKNPTRKEIIKELAEPGFSLEGVTGEIRFNTSTDRKRNGDRKNFSPKLVRLFKCEDDNHFASISLDDTQAEDLICQAGF